MANASFLYPLKISENLIIFCFHGVKKGCIGSRFRESQKTFLIYIHKISGQWKRLKFPAIKPWITLFQKIKWRNWILRIVSFHLFFFVQFAADSWSKKVFVVVSNFIAVFSGFFSLHARLNNHYAVWDCKKMRNKKDEKFLGKPLTHPPITCSKLTIETLEHFSC